MSDNDDTKKLIKKLIIIIAALFVLSFGFRLLNGGPSNQGSFFGMETKEETAKRKAIEITNARIKYLDSLPKIWEKDAEEEAKKNNPSASF